MATKKTDSAKGELATKKKNDSYTGVQIHEVPNDLINQIYADKVIDIPDKRLTWYPNQFVYLKANDTSGTTGAITSVSADCKQLILVNKNNKASGIVPKNKEQTMALSALLDDNIKLLTLTGKAGTGKTLLTIAAALQKIDDGKYERIIITRPMSQVGNYDLGALPGDVDEKFGPYLENYISNIQQLGGKHSKSTALDIIRMYKMEAMPLQLIRGASWTKTFIIADEVQVLDKHEMLTLGTRVGEGSKLIVMGDLNQRDEDIARTATGLYHIINSKKIKESPLTSHIELIKSERSPLAELFTEAFEDLD